MISHNDASSDGGSVYNWGGTVQIQRSELLSNWAANRGGGIYNNGSGIFKVVDSTIAYNQTDGSGGGAYNHYSELTLVNSTVSGNSAYGDGGGIFEESTDTLYLYNATITENIADWDDDNSGDGGGLVAGGNIHVFNSILAGNLDLSTGAEISIHPDCTVRFSSATYDTGFNVVGDNSGCEDIFVDGVSGNQVGSAINPLDPLLGITEQRPAARRCIPSWPAARPSMPATLTAAVKSTRPDPTDQRGMSRPQEVCDAGAYEAARPSIPDQFDVEFSPNGTLVGFVEADDLNLGYSLLCHYRRQRRRRCAPSPSMQKAAR